MNIPNEIKRIRQETGITLRHAGDLIGKTERTMWAYEQGDQKISAEDMEILRAFAVDKFQKAG